MKKILFLLLYFFPVILFGQERKETINKEFPIVSGQVNTLWIDNISGSVKVEGYNGSAVVIEAIKQVKSSTQEELENSWQRLQLKFEQYNDTIAAYPTGICDCNCDSHHHRRNWNNCNFDDDFSIDFIIKVPVRINLLLSTVNNGNITVNNSSGGLKIRNVNGGITLDHISGAADVNTINGDVTITYSKNPVANSKYYTLNGKLTVYYKPDLSAEMSFKSFNGSFYTDFDIDMLPSARLVSTSEEKSGPGITYKIERKTLARVGHGDINLQFETLNGNIFIRKNSN